jgi:hypothetical protein
MGLALAGLAGLWMLLGVVLIWDARSPVTRTVGFLVFTFPATMLLIFGPAAILIWQNLE